MNTIRVFLGIMILLTACGREVPPTPELPEINWDEDKAQYSPVDPNRNFCLGVCCFTTNLDGCDEE